MKKSEGVRIVPAFCRTAPLLLAFTAAAGLVACRRPPETKPAASRTPAAERPKGASVGAVVKRPLSALDVMVLVYGRGSGPNAVPKWRPKKLWQDKDGPPIDAQTEFVCEDLQLLPFRQGDAARAFVMASARPADYNCHPCAPLLGGVGLTEVADGWRIDSVDPEIGAYGSFGAAPEGSIVQFGPDRFGVMLAPGFTGMGVTTSGLSLLAEHRNGGFAEILSLGETASENGGDCGEEEGSHPCWEFTSRWEFVQTEGRDLWDFKITTKGNRPRATDGEVEDFSEKALYRFDGTKYTIVK